VLLSVIAMCRRSSVEPIAWFREVLSRMTTHSVHRLAELLPHRPSAELPLNVGSGMFPCTADLEAKLLEFQHLLQCSSNARQLERTSARARF